MRRYKSERNISLGAELARLSLVTDDAVLAAALRDAAADLTSVTRARTVEVVARLEPGLETLPTAGSVRAAVEPA